MCREEYGQSNQQEFKPGYIYIYVVLYFSSITNGYFDWKFNMKRNLF